MDRRRTVGERSHRAPMMHLAQLLSVMKTMMVLDHRPFGHGLVHRNVVIAVHDDGCGRTVAGASRQCGTRTQGDKRQNDQGLSDIAHDELLQLARVKATRNVRLIFPGYPTVSELQAIVSVCCRSKNATASTCLRLRVMGGSDCQMRLP